MKHKLKESVVLKVTAHIIQYCSVAIIIAAVWFIVYSIDYNYFQIELGEDYSVTEEIYPYITSYNEDFLWTNYEDSYNFSKQVQIDIHNLLAFIRTDMYYADEVKFQYLLNEKIEENVKKLEEEKEYNLNIVKENNENVLKSINEYMNIELNNLDENNENNKKSIEKFLKEEMIDNEEAQIQLEELSIDYETKKNEIIESYELKQYSELHYGMNNIDTVESRFNQNLNQIEVTSLEQIIKEKGIFNKEIYEFLKSIYKNENTNFRYLVIDTNSNNMFTNFDIYNINNIANSNSGIKDYFTNKAEYSRISDLKVDELIDFIERTPYHFIYDDNNYLRNNSITKIPWKFQSDLSLSNIEKGYNFKVYVAVNTAFTESDIYKDASDSYNKHKVLYERIIIGIICSFILFVICIIYLISSTGHKRGHEGIYLNFFDKIYIEGIILIVAIFLMFLMEAYYSIDEEVIILINIVYILFLAVLLSLVRRIKSKTLFTCSLALSIFKLIITLISYIKIQYKLAAGLLVYTFVFICLIIFSISEYTVVEFAILFIIWIMIGVAYLLKTGKDLRMIYIGTKKIAQGELEYKISIDKHWGIMKGLGEYINNIGEGLNIAVEESVKNERVQADLITNVSHDIRTPLTSIINYVNLLKRESIQDEKIKGYIDILDTKSQRLKSLTEDLVEATKASSGAMKINFEVINLIELLKQSNGEFEDRFNAKGLQIIMNISKESILVKADGKRMYRVLENLYSNINKYALNNTRVYIDANEEGENALVSIKNISMDALNISSDELTERFIRGDKSRSSEGSGLGLSIAKSLMHLQKGSFDIYLDGDLFKVTIKLLLSKELHD